MAISSIGDIFFQWETLGIFDFLLPFLLVFALVFGILSTTGIMGRNRGVSIIVAFVIGLMSLRYQFFLSDFLSELFPRVGIGIGVLLTVMIFVGLFIPVEEKKYWLYGLGAIGMIIAIVVLSQTGQRLGWTWFNSSNDNVGFIVLAVLIIGVIIAVAASGSSSNPGEGKGKATLQILRAPDPS